jgi:hypothetical protein
MKKDFRIVLQVILPTGFLFLFLSSCTHYYYVPNIQNVPMFRGKNEFRLSGAEGGGEKSSCAEIQAAYSASDKIGIMMNYMSARGGKVSTDHDWAMGNYFDAGIGYFRPVSRHGVFEVYGGLGHSIQQHSYPDAGRADLSFTKVWVQPSFGYTLDFIDIAFSTRLNSLSFNNIENRIDQQKDGYEYDRLYSLEKERNYIFFEPAVTIRGGWKYIKIQFQGSTSSYSKRNLPFEEYHLSLGVCFSIADRFGKNAVNQE